MQILKENHCSYVKVLNIEAKVKVSGFKNQLVTPNKN